MFEALHEQINQSKSTKTAWRIYYYSYIKKVKGRRIQNKFYNKIKINQKY